MFKPKLVTKEDLDEAAKLSKRNQYEEQRKKRIFNAKERMFGVDLSYLQRQLGEKNLVKTQQLEKKLKEDALVQAQDRAMRSMELAQREQQRLTQADLNRYRCAFQRKDQAREYDLNDPNILKKTPPIRTGDYDLALGISSAQIFEGEDLGARERHRRQFEQQRAWLDQQILERKQAEISKQQAEQKYQQSYMERECCLADMAVSQQRVRSQILDSVHEHNRKMAEQKRFERERAKRENMEDDLAEIYNMLSSDMLSENPAAGMSCTKPNQRVAYLYRGLTPEEKVRFRSAQAEQKRRIAERKEHGKLLEKQWEQHLLNVDRELKLKELELSRREKNALDVLVECNKNLAREHRQRKLQDDAMKRNIISDEFFKKFNTTSR